MATDDFSFPAHKSPCIIDSPPLWRPSASSAAEDQYPKEEEDEDPNIIDIVNHSDQRRKSFSHMEVTGGKMGETKVDEEEKMDMLWEGFNDELRSRSTAAPDYYSGRFSREMMQLGCAGRGFRLSNSKTSGDHHALSTRKPSLVAIARVFKRLLFLHNSHHDNQKINKHAW